jgi:biotin transport system substrate-specific component
MFDKVYTNSSQNSSNKQWVNMEIAARINQARYDAFKWRFALSVPKKLALALGMACLMGLVAQLRVVIPWSPIPITGQTFAVLLAGVLLGRWWGGVGVALYGLLGVAGVPWFAGWGSGLGYLAGPTGGYIVGFVLAALFLGHFTDTYVRSRSFLSMLALMLFANFALIYIPGLTQLGLWLNMVEGEQVSIASLLGMGMLPFIVGDVIKAALAAAIVRGITPKSAYGRETDEDRWAKWRLP